MKLHITCALPLLACILIGLHGLTRASGDVSEPVAFGWQDGFAGVLSSLADFITVKDRSH